jgi:hypothetical protein
VQRAYAEEERTLNRRVEVEVTDTIVEERQDRVRSAAAPLAAPPAIAAEASAPTATAGHAD